MKITTNDTSDSLKPMKITIRKIVKPRKTKTESLKEIDELLNKMK